MKLVILTICAIFCLRFSIVAQAVRTIDGISIGERSELILACSRGVADYSSIVVNAENYGISFCTCFIDELVPKLTFNEIKSAMEDGSGELSKLIYKGDNFSLLKDCISDLPEISKDVVIRRNDISNSSYQFLISACVDSALADPDISSQWSIESAKEFCVCAYDKMLSIGYSYEEVLAAGNVDSRVFNEVFISCIGEINSNMNFEEVTFDINEVSGTVSESKVKLIDSGNGVFRVLLTIGGVSRYFVLDSGASSIVINSELEHELRRRGIIGDKNYIGKRNYMIADGNYLELDVIWIDEIKIGDFTVSNTETVIINGGDLLCGKSLLDKFARWSINTQNSTLLLKR